MTKINRQNYDYIRSERVSWLDEFAKDLEKKSKTAVEVARHNYENSIYEQINSIMNGNASSKTVDGVVKELQERTGLKAYLNNISNKIASDKLFPLLSDDVENDIVEYTKNYVENYTGAMSLPSIIHDVSRTFSARGLTEDMLHQPSVMHMFNSLLAKKEKEFDKNDCGSMRDVDFSNVEYDEENSDFMASMMPTTK